MGFGLVNRLTDHLQVVTITIIITITEIHTLQITIRYKYSPACSVFNRHFLVTDFNSGDSSASAQVLSSQPPVQNSLGCPNCLQDNSSTWTTQRTPFILICQPFLQECVRVTQQWLAYHRLLQIQWPSNCHRFVTRTQQWVYTLHCSLILPAYHHFFFAWGTSSCTATEFILWIYPPLLQRGLCLV
jgi:hypothetical protein